MRKIQVVLSFFFLATAGLVLPGEVRAQSICRPEDYGGIQGALDACGGGEARLQSGKTYITGSIRIPGNTTLNVNGATVKASSNQNDFEGRAGFSRKLFIANGGSQNITVLGPGTITVSDSLDPRPAILDFADVSGLTIRGLDASRRLLIDTDTGSVPSGQQSHIGFGRSRDVTIEHITIRGVRAYGGNDGINIDSSQNVVVRDCDINTHDVAITFGASPGNPEENIVVENCRLSSARTGMTFGTQGNHILRNIKVRNIEIYDTGEAYGNRGTKFEIFFGGELENVSFSNFSFSNVPTHMGCSVGQLRYPPEVVGKCVDSQSTVKNLCFEGFSQADLDFVRKNLTNDFTTNCGAGGGFTPPPKSTSTPTPKPAASVGDLDKDGDVDIFDYNILVANFGRANCGNVADISPPAGGDCKVDIFDYDILAANFGSTIGQTPTPTPSLGIIPCNQCTNSLPCSNPCEVYEQRKTCGIVWAGWWGNSCVE